MNGSDLSKMEELKMDDDEWSGWPSTSRSEPLIAQVKNVICGYGQLTAREVADDVGISTGSYHKILSENLGMHRVLAKFVPRLLTYDLR
jgi:hypothetical protein